ncbi:MAG: hypothetical protein WCD37_02205 [Chloroflexia bacterium]
MNPPSRWRLDIARRLATLYAANPNVAAVLAGGSTARGHADKYSDLEFGVFWHQPPTDEERKAAIALSGGDLIRIYPYDPQYEVWADDLMMGRAAPDAPQSGLLVEIVHYTADFMDRTLDNVLLQHDPDEDKQVLLSAILTGIPFHNEPLLHRWRQRVSSYPDELAAAVVKRHSQIDHFWRSEMFLHRHENLMMLYHSFDQVQVKLLHVLLGMNHTYYFGFKWLDVVASHLPIAPPDLLHRLRQVYQIAPAQAAPLLAALVEETYDLIEQHVPGIDVDWLRRVFRYRRPSWEEPPPYGL